FTVNDGLLADLITFVQLDKGNNIWIGTNRGLNKFDQQTKRLYSYTEKNGFVGIEAKNNASFLDDQGHLWFGTVNGVMKYDPEKSRNKNLEPLTHITGLKVNLKEVNMTDH